ncbi:hypothetical protein L5515_011349 [Caenorhabditis briggsae]|uniref:Uncharacterized protein n=1 Tax=Caenorhabditis briggsae TaxID=6238 RepID=A0AAE9JFD6_CAEBR|nr:hypothetical protein L5515_011349 [Caenorhabditis briggsae]
MKEPNAQNLNHVILGFFGMIISVWTLFGFIIATDYRFDSFIFALIHFLALCFFLASYLMICNACSDPYSILPPENRPFFGIKINVALFGLFHLTVSIVSFFLTKFWPICCLLQFSSFILSINAWACYFTESYILCEHRIYQWDMEDSPVDGIICQVAVRRNSGDMEDKTNLPIGFQFDDKLDISSLRGYYRFR